MRVTGTGQFGYCRTPATSDSIIDPRLNIANTSPITFFQKGMANIRSDMAKGISPGPCVACDDMERHHKVSARQGQLLKTGIKGEYYEKSLTSSPWFPQFIDAIDNGETDLYPQDWQIDLGNLCNSNCVMCSPTYSSKLAAEWKKLNLITTVPRANWSEDPVQVDKLIDVLVASKKLAYIHFIGGETLITPAFKVILSRLIAEGISGQVTLGFTTNLTVWDDSINALLVQFKEINLGVSIECLHNVNDYIRYPSNIESVKSVLDKWVELSNKHKWITQIRTTPTILSLLHMDTIFEYAYNQGNISVESCNFLEWPVYMRSTVLPMEYRLPIIAKLKAWVASKDTIVFTDKIINTRSPSVAKQQVIEDAISYISYLENQPDESFKLPELIAYLKKLETNRHNSILDYLPEYEQLFKDAGY